MKAVMDLRRENLRTLMKTWGGPTSLARKLGHANGSYLAQLAGPKPTRAVSEKVAREIEETLLLPHGWLDREQPTSTERLDQDTLAACVRLCAIAIRAGKVDPSPDQISILVGLVYDYFRLTGKMDESHLAQLITLLKRG